MTCDSEINLYVFNDNLIMLGLYGFNYSLKTLRLLCVERYFDHVRVKFVIETLDVLELYMCLFTI
jgi:hypothetical protein